MLVTIEGIDGGGKSTLAKSLADVGRDTGLTKDAASVRASVLRKRGVRLRRFNEATGRPPLDVDALNRLAKESFRG